MDRAGKIDRQPAMPLPHDTTLTLQALRDSEAGAVPGVGATRRIPTVGRSRARGYPSKDGAKSAIAPA
jgi:hypothetical protein